MNDPTQCTHEKQFPMPDSLARVCEDCGQVFVAGEPWEYKSGNIVEWVKDLAQTTKPTEGSDPV